MKLQHPILAAFTFLLLSGLIPSPAAAQKPLPVSMEPVKSGDQIQTDLFNLPEDQDGCYFRIDLPGRDHLLIRFAKLSYWKTGRLPEIFATAATSWMQMKDTFANQLHAHRLALYLPPGSSTVIAGVRETAPALKSYLLSGGAVQEMRVAMDTISVLKAYLLPEKDSNVYCQVQYCFLLGGLEDIKDLTIDTGMVRQISNTMDSMVTAKRKEWKRQDAFPHRLQAWYDVHEGPAFQPLLKTASPQGSIKQRDFSADVGLSFVAGTITGFVSLRAMYQWPDRQTGGARFAGLSYSALNIPKQQDGVLSVRYLGFVNAEFGSLTDRRTLKYPGFRTSAGIGYRVMAHDEGMYDFRYRFFLNYSISPVFTVTPELYLTEENNAFVGMIISIRLL